MIGAAGIQAAGKPSRFLPAGVLKEQLRRTALIDGARFARGFEQTIAQALT